MAQCGPEPYLRLLRQHHPRLQPRPGTSACSTACSTPMNYEEPAFRPRTAPSGYTKSRQWNWKGVVEEAPPRSYLHSDDLSVDPQPAPIVPAEARPSRQGRPMPGELSDSPPKLAQSSWSEPPPPQPFHERLAWRDSEQNNTVRMQTHNELDSAKGSSLVQDLASANERCPHCTRTFSKEAAARHIPICSQLKNRAKPPPSKDMARSNSRPCSRPASAAASPMNVNTPSRSSRCQHSNRAGSSSIQAKTLNMGEEPVTAVLTGPKAKLSEQWGVLQFLLRDGVDIFWDDKHINRTATTVDECLKLIESIESYAVQLRMRKGAISRMLLPFDTETDSNDQASSAAQAPLGSKELNGLIPDEERRTMVQTAIKLRRLVRVKVADCNDMEQAKEALRLADDFLRDLKRVAEEEQCKMTAILRDL